MKFSVGIDEAGRGPLAGPVAVGVVVIDSGFRIPKSLNGVVRTDSKKLSEKSRELWFTAIQQWQKEGKLRYACALISAKEIDGKGIVPAIKKGMATCLKKLSVPKNAEVFLDGSLYLPKEYIKQKTIIKGDEKIPIISLASIVAKVTRDKYMKTLAKKYPGYGFEVHKGYGTKAHYAAIQKEGISDVHRKSFLKKLL